MLDWESLLVVETTNSKNQISLGDHVGTEVKIATLCIIQTILLAFSRSMGNSVRYEANKNGWWHTEYATGW